MKTCSQFNALKEDEKQYKYTETYAHAITRENIGQKYTDIY